MKFVGVDLAAQPARTSLCVLNWKGTPRVDAVHRPANDECIIRISETAMAIGLDSPFGWPRAFVSFVQEGLASAHRAPLANDEADRLKYRATDRWLREQDFAGGRPVRPLSVATDKLGAVALRCVRLVQCLEASRGDRSTIYEVYPAATLARWMTVAGSYKKRDSASKAIRRHIISRLVEQGLDLGDWRQTLVASDDDLDALVSALTAALAFAGRTELPLPSHAASARSEGWIHIPSGPLSDLSSLCLAKPPSRVAYLSAEHPAGA